jgi:hypothetical protein
MSSGMPMWSRAVAFAAVLSSGCAIVQDFDHYSARRGDGVDAASDDTDVVVEDSAVVIEEDTAVTVADSGTAPPADTKPVCGAGTMDCGGGCIDILNDRDHCGGCTSCEQQGLGGATQCVAGKCECRPNAKECNKVCTYTDNDPVNCGACGSKIADATVACGGTASPNCIAPLRECKPWGSSYGVTCPVKCVDTASEGNHCYRYEPPTTHYERCYLKGACVDHVCGGTCPKDRLECVSGMNTNVEPSVRSCVDGLHDPNHCGACNKRCVVGEVCAEGACKAYRPARTAADCTATEKLYTPAGWSKPVGIRA